MKKFHTHNRIIVFRIVTISLVALFLYGCEKGNEQGSIQSSQELGNSSVSTFIPTPTLTSGPIESSELVEPTYIPTSNDYSKRAEMSLVKGDLITVGNILSDIRTYSDKEKNIRDGGIVALNSSDELYLVDSIFNIERQRISFDVPSEGGYTLSVNSCTISENIRPTGNLYAAQLSGKQGDFGIQLLVEVEQTTEVYEYHVFSYFIAENHEYLQKIGILAGRLSEIGSNIFTVRQASVIIDPFSYEYPQKYVLCSAGRLEEGKLYYSIGKVPEGYYPMNKIVKLNQDVLLYDRDTLKETAKVESGSYLMLCATDSEKWIYVEDIATTLSGWLCIETDENGKRVVLGTDQFSVKDIFDNGTLQYGY